MIHTLDSDELRVAVLGGGHAGRGLAGYLSLKGFDVSLFNRTLKNVEEIKNRRGLDVHGIIEGFAPISLVTDDMTEAITNRNIVIITVPAQAHRYYARKIAHCLEDNQTLLLMPGRTGGALEFANLLKQQHNLDEILLGEAQTFSFVSRSSGSCSVLISKAKNRVQVSALPSTRNHEFLDRLKKIPVPLTSASNVLETSLNNVGAMLHPTPTVLCAGVIDSGCWEYNHYHDAISESVGKLIERIDAERVAVAREFSMTPMSLIEWLKEAYSASGQSLCECIKSIDAYDEVGNPTTLFHRYVLEDIPTGLVPISRLASLCGLSTPAIDSVINIACQLYNRDFWQEGRSLTSMGLSNMTPSDVIEFVNNGEGRDEYIGFENIWHSYHVGVDDS